MSTVISCRHCAGALQYLGALGRLVYAQCRDCGLTQATRLCPDCYGMGEIDGESETGPGGMTELSVDTCPTCDGSGLVPTPEP